MHQKDRNAKTLTKIRRVKLQDSEEQFYKATTGNQLTI